MAKSDVPVGLKKFATHWRMCRPQVARINYAMSRNDEAELRRYARDCADDFIAEKVKQRAEKKASALAATDSCDPLRVAETAQQAIVTAAQQTLFTEQLTLMILTMWRMRCEMGM